MIAAAVIAGLIILFGIILYNSLIAKKNQVANAFSAIDVMLKKRFDLLPNLVELVKQYMKHESEVLQNITSLRTQTYNPNMAADEKLNLDSVVSQGIRSVMINAESYPELKANTNFLNLQATWTESEEQIAAARRAYNASVTDYNNATMMFPGSIIANILNYTQLPVMVIPDQERVNIQAKDLFRN